MDLNLAWCAGFFDGEGNTRYIGRKGRSIVMRVEQVNRENLERLQINIGGDIKGPYNFKSRPNNKPIYFWSVSGAHKCKKAIRLLWPFLGREKKLQFLRAARAYVHEGVRRRKQHRHGPKPTQYHTESV